MGVNAVLMKFRCVVRTRGFTLSIECLAATSAAAAYAVGALALKDDPAPWVQVVVAQWNPSLRQYVVEPNAIVVTRDDELPVGTDKVVIVDSRRHPSSRPAKPD